MSNIKAVSKVREKLLPSEGGSIGAVVCIGDGESEQDVSVRLVLLDVDSVVPLGEDGIVVVDILDVDVEQDARRQRWSSLVFGLHFQD